MRFTVECRYPLDPRLVLGDKRQALKTEEGTMPGDQPTEVLVLAEGATTVIQVGLDDDDLLEATRLGVYTGIQALLDLMPEEAPPLPYEVHVLNVDGLVRSLQGEVPA